MTDVVDSTALLESFGDERMAELWAAHDEVTRELLDAHRGREIDKSEGLLLLFESAEDAVALAASYHRALTERLAEEAGDLALVCRARDALQISLQGSQGSERALAISARSVARGVGLADDLRCGLLNKHAINHGNLGGIEEAVGFYEEALALTAGQRQFEINIRLNLASVLEERARGGEALEQVGAARDVGSSVGLVAQVALTDIIEAGLLQALGRLDEAQRMVGEGLDALDRLGAQD